MIAAAGLCPLLAAAQKYPEKSIRLIVPFPSGASQILGILVSEKLAEALGQPVVVDFRPGAGGTLGAEVAARAPNDGYTLLLTSVSLTISPSIMNAPEVKRQLVKVEVEPVTSTPSEFGALFRKESETWARVIREANIKFE